MLRIDFLVDQVMPCTHKYLSHLRRCYRWRYVDFSEQYQDSAGHTIPTYQHLRHSYTQIA